LGQENGCISAAETQAAAPASAGTDIINGETIDEGRWTKDEPQITD
jgi:hypothetical protein